MFFCCRIIAVYIFKRMKKAKCDNKVKFFFSISRLRRNLYILFFSPRCAEIL